MLALAPYAGLAPAQQVTGTLGSPGATTTLEGKQLPPPDSKFGGEIKEKASDSKGWWKPRVVPPTDAPTGTIDKLTFKLAADPVRAEQRESTSKTVARARD